jgi:hypothetical protein
MPTPTTDTKLQLFSFVFSIRFDVSKTITSILSGIPTISIVPIGEYDYPPLRSVISVRAKNLAEAISFAKELCTEITTLPQVSSCSNLPPILIEGVEVIQEAAEEAAA